MGQIAGAKLFEDTNLVKSGIWQLIAMNHAGGDMNRKFYWNEGVLMSSIIDDAKEYLTIKRTVSIKDAKTGC